MKEVNESIGRLISILYRTGQSHIGKRLEPYGVGSGQFSFLAELFQLEGISQDELAAYFRCDKATVARALQRLEREGYVERKRSTDDGRVKLVYLTKKAYEFKPTLFMVLSEWTESLTQGFSDSEERQVIQLLSQLVENAFKENDQNREKA